MPPLACVAAVVQVGVLPALRTAESRLAAVEVEVDAHGLFLDVELHITDEPGRLDAQELMIKLCVLHNARV